MEKLKKYQLCIDCEHWAKKVGNVFCNNCNDYSLFKKVKRKKYNAKKTIIDGITFDSIKESVVYISLVSMKKCTDLKHRVIEIVLQPKFPYQITYSANGKTFKKKAFYKADFSVSYADGHNEIIDVKGVRTATYKRKKKIVEFLYGIQIIEK